ncbi:MAG: TonB-dependent receptor [Candidatus Methylacidiphilaceae bacterium]
MANIRNVLQDNSLSRLCAKIPIPRLLLFSLLVFHPPIPKTCALGGPTDLSDVSVPSAEQSNSGGKTTRLGPLIFHDRNDADPLLPTQPEDTSRIPWLTPVEVVAPRNPKEAQPIGISTTVKEITEKQAVTSDTTNLMNDVPGAFTQSAGGVSGLPVIDGFADDRLHSEVAGMPLTSACPNHMNPPLSYMPPSQVGSMHVYNNIVPVSVGGDSIGGAILAEPPLPVFAQKGQTFAKGEIGPFYRSNGNAFGGYLSGTAATDRFSITYNGSYAQSENYYAGAAFHPAGPAFLVGIAPNKSALPYTREGNAIPWIGGNEVGSTYYQTQNHDIGMAFHQENHLIRLNLGVQDIPFQAYPNQRMDMTNNLALNANLRYTGQYDWGVLEGQAYNQNIHHKMDFGENKQYYYGSPQTILADGMPMFSRANNTGAKVKASIPLSDQHILRVGSEYQRYIDDEYWPPSPTTLPPGYLMGGMAPNTFLLLNNGQRDRYDVFAEWDARWNARWTSQLGVRSDTVLMNTGPVQGYNPMYDRPPLSPATRFNDADRSRAYQNWNATALATYTPTKTQFYSLGYSLKSRAPNLYELYTWSTSMMAMEMVGWFGDGNYYVGNLNLRPEIANTISATADWHDTQGNYALQVTPYYSYIYDYIDVQRLPGALGGTLANLNATQGFVSLQFVNVDAQIFGADVSGHALLAKDTPLGDFEIKGLASYVRGERSGGQNLYHMMPLNSTLTLSQKFAGLTNSVQGQFVAAKNTVEELRNEIPTSAYALLNLSTSYEWKSVRVEAGIQNVCNSLYYLPLGGAYIGQGATMSGPMGPAWGIALPGMGRMYYVGANLTF